MSTQDFDRPMPLLFLWEARDYQEAHKAQHGAYTDSFFELGKLGFVFDGSGSFNIHDPGVAPTERDRRQWQPKNSTVRYRILRATADHFHIQALDADGNPTHEVRAGMEQPQALPDPSRADS